MNPIIRSNILLSVVAVALSLGIYLHYRQSGESYVAITQVATDKVQQLSILKDGKPLAVLKRQQAQWKDATHDNAPANINWIEKLLHLSQLPSLHHFPLADKSPDSFGLNPPRYTLKLDDTVLQFGKIDPASGLRFVQAGDQIHLISDSYTHYLYQQPSD